MPLYSHSRLGTYENCPFQYKLRYVDRVKPVLGNTIESFMGSMVHDALEWLYKLARDSNVASKASLLEKYDQLWSEKWKDDINSKWGFNITPDKEGQLESSSSSTLCYGSPSALS